MSAPGSAPGDGIVFAYLKDLLNVTGRPMSVQGIADGLGWVVDDIRRVAGEAAEAGLLDVSDGLYSLSDRGSRR